MRLCSVRSMKLAMTPAHRYAANGHDALRAVARSRRYYGRVRCRRASAWSWFSFQSASTRAAVVGISLCHQRCSVSGSLARIAEVLGNLALVAAES